MRLAEHVEHDVPRRRLAQPRLVEAVECRRVRPDPTVPDDVPLERRQRGGDGRERSGGDGDLDVLVLTGDRAEVQVDRPPGGDAPRHVDAGQAIADHLGRPRAPSSRHSSREIGSPSTDAATRSGPSAFMTPGTVVGEGGPAEPARPHGGHHMSARSRGTAADPPRPACRRPRLVGRRQVRPTSTGCRRQKPGRGREAADLLGQLAGGPDRRAVAVGVADDLHADGEARRASGRRVPRWPGGGR